MKIDKRTGSFLNDNGQILLVSLIVMIVGFTVGAGFLMNSRISAKTNQAQLDTDKAYYLAVSGLDIARKNLTIDFANWDGLIHPVAFAGGSFTVSLDPAAPRSSNDPVTVTSSGFFRNSSYQITKQISST